MRTHLAAALARPRILTALLVVTGLVLAAAAVTGVLLARRGMTSRDTVVLGVYAAPGQKGVRGARDFDRVMHQDSAVVLDFPPGDDWSQIEGQPWLLRPHSKQKEQRLEYSLPVVPHLPGTSLQACAQGDYDGHWAALGHNLVAWSLADTIVRPGWEFNGDWYAWQAGGQAAAYASCFRHVVDSMRAVPGQHFAYDWNVNVGPSPMDATAAWPGRNYVDYVGVDAYDMSTTRYHAGETPSAIQQRQAVTELLDGRWGMRFWADFAARHGRPLAIPEWGLTWRADGHGGGDNAIYVRAMFRFFDDPANHVAYVCYFNSGDSTVDHRLTGRTRFGSAQAAYAQQVTSQTEDAEAGGS